MCGLLLKGGGGRETGLSSTYQSQCRAGGGDILLRKVASRLENSFRVKGHFHAVKL